MRSAETSREPQSGEPLEKVDLAADVDPAPVLDRLAVEEERGTLNWETGWS